MKILYVCPDEYDDPKAFAISMRRLKITSDYLDGIRPEGDLYVEFLANMEAANFDTIKSVSSIAVGARFFTQEKTEADYLDGTYAHTRKYHDFCLENLKVDLQRNARGSTVAFVDLGNSLTALYAATFLAAYAVPMVVSYTEPDGETPFALGGTSAYAKSVPYLRRALTHLVLNSSEFVFVGHEDIASALYALFPQESRAFEIDLFSDDRKEAVLKSLPSQ